MFVWLFLAFPDFSELSSWQVRQLVVVCYLRCQHFVNDSDCLRGFLTYLKQISVRSYLLSTVCGVSIYV